MNNWKWIFLTVVILFLSLGCYTFYKVSARHTEHLIEVSEKKIVEAAKQCVWDDVCQEEKISLGFLIDQNYIHQEVNPITKMYYSKESYVLKEDMEYSFHEV